ncbi:MAG: hypothetical protein IPO41_05745 [Acidobacteria bacterium]|nr:hypothetical protein [Acidobacteriota bacterium]
MKVMLTTNGRRAAVFFCFLLLSVAGVMGVFTDRSSAQSKPKGNGRSEIGAIQVGEPSIPTISVRADSLPEYRIPDGPIIEVNPRRTRPPRKVLDVEQPSFTDPLISLQQRTPDAAPNAFTTPILNFNGIAFTGVNPPDTVGDVGPNHYVQSINGSGGSVVRIFDKTTGAPIGVQFAMDGLAGASPCNSGAGDPIILYDQAADRWMLSEFSGSGNRLCVYVSTTPDPAGTYAGYQFQAPGFPDYPKYGVWPDAYYVSSNESSPAVYALDRVKMLAGQAATFQRFTAVDLSGFGFQALTPADLDGAAAPPAGAPGIFMRHRDTEVHGPAGFPSSDILEIYAFDVDWVTPANSTFTQLPDVGTTEANHMLTAPSVKSTGLDLPSLVNSEFSSNLCGLTSFSCMGMPGATQGSGGSLDPLREVIMNRLVYRNFGTHETLVGNFVTNVGAASPNSAHRGGVRWFELRRVGAGSWTLHQEGTFAPTVDDNRWMAAIAMDGSGNIALGYNISSSTIFPGLRYTGRLASDPLGTMSQGDNVLVSGTANNGSNRYGDYSAMSVDPSDDCTFWFTGQWNGASSWSTRIGKIKFDQCGTPDFILAATPQTQNVCVGSNAVYNVNVGSVSGYNSPVTLTTTGNPGSVGFSVNPVTPAGASTMTLSGAAAGTYNFNIVGTAAGPNVKQFAAGLVVAAGNPVAPTLTAPVNAATNIAATPTFTWGAVAEAASYTIEVSTNNTFTNIVASASGLINPTWTSNVTLNTSSTYFWRVRAVNACGTGLNSTTYTFTTVAAPGDCGPGTTVNTIYQYGFEAGASGWTQGAGGTGTNTWAVVTSNPRTGTSHYRGVGTASVTDQRLVSPPISLPTGQNPLVLKFWHAPNLEPNAPNCYDAGIVEVSVNSGSTWTQIPGASILAGPYTGTISTGFSNPLGGLNGWCNGSAYFQSIADVSSYAGQNAQFRLRIGTDTSVAGAGWDVDDVVVQGCTAGGTPTPTATPTNTPTATPTNTPTATPTNTPTATPTVVPTATPTNTPTATPTGTPTATPTGTPTNTPTATPTPLPGGGIEGDVAPRPVGDGVMNVTDVVQLRRFATTLDTPDPGNERQRADCAPLATGGDGNINAGDVIQGRRYAASLDPPNPTGGPTGPSGVPEVVSSIIDDLYAYFFGREVSVGSAKHDGTRVTVPVEITAVGDELALGFTLEYDASRLTDPQIVLGDGAAEGSILTVNSTEAGRVGILVDSTEPMTASATPKRIVMVTFEISGDANGEAAITFTNSLAQRSVVGEAGSILSTRYIDGSVSLEKVR